MNKPPLLLPLAFALAAFALSPVSRTLAQWDPYNPYPTGGACCPCIQSPVTVSQLEAPGGTVLTGPKSIEQSECVTIKQDKTGYYHLKFIIPNTCTNDPMVLLRDQKGEEWQGTGDVVEFSLIARNVELPIDIQIICSDGEVCRTGCLDASCRACEKVCPIGVGDLAGGVSPDGAGGGQGEFHGGAGIGNSDQGDSETGLDFEIDPTQDLEVDDLEIDSNGGYTKTTSGANVDINTATTYAGVSPSGSSDVEVKIYRKTGPDGTPTGGTPESSAFKTILFKNLSGNVLRAEITDHDNASTTSQEWRHPNATTWVYVSGSGMRKEVLTSVVNSGATLRTDRLKIYERHSGASGEVAEVAGNLVSDVETRYEGFGSQWKRVKEIIDPSGAALVTEWGYYLLGQETYPASYSGALLKSWMRRYDGYQENYYYGTNAKWVTYSFGSNPDGRSVMTTWDPATKTKSESVSILGTVISVTNTIQTWTGETRNEFYDGTQFLSTVTTFVAPGSDFGGRPTKIQHPDNTISTYAYLRSGGNKTVTMERGAGTTTVTEGTSTVSTYSPKGVMVEEKTTAKGTGAGTVLAHMKYHAKDAFDRPTSIYYFPDGTGANPKWTETLTYNCCGIATETDRYGITSTHGYDDLKRRISTARLGITQQTAYDALTVTSRRVVAGVGTFDVAKSVRNLAGTYSESHSPSPESGNLEKMSSTVVTFRNPWSTTPNPGGLAAGIGKKSVTTVIRVDDDGTVDRFQASNFYLDGQIYRTWGDLEPARQFLYGAGVAETNHLSGTINSTHGTGGATVESRFTYFDVMGRVTYEKRGGGWHYRYYNVKGQLDRTQDPDGVVTRYAYNSVGEQVVTARKLNSTTGSITYGTDRVTRTETKPATRGGTQVLRTITKVWKDGDTSDTGGTVVSTQDRTPDGLQSWTEVLGVIGVASSTVTLQGAGDWQEVSIAHDQTRTVTSYVDGLWDQTIAEDAATPTRATVSWTSARKADNSLGYDAHKRLTHQKDSRAGVTETQYVSAISDAMKKIIPPAGSAQETVFTYDHRGRQVEVDAPQSLDASGAPLNNITSTTYYPSGSVKEVSGQQAYPVTYSYDYAGRMLTMTTSSAAGNSTTRWVYSTSTGRLTGKLYNWTDDATINEYGPSYTYTAAGRLLTRSWVRVVSGTTKVTATYGYTRGLLTSVTYNDGVTPSVTYNYNAFPTDNYHIPGDLETVTRGGATWTYKYHPTELRLLSETHPVGGTAIERILTRSYDTVGRPDGFVLGTAGDPDIDHSVTYGYDLAGRPDEVIGAGKTFNYGYTANSYGLIGTVAGPAGIGVTNTWESNRDVLSVKKNEVASGTVSQFTYGVDHLGQRTGVTTTGSAFANINRGWTWGYDALGQVTKATHATSTGDSELDRTYAYDNIGNRTGATNGSGTEEVAIAYTPDKLNQYDTINPGAPVDPVYDLDGNLKEDAAINAMGYGLKLDWDAENRVTAVRKADNTLLATYVYDYLGRRIRKATTASAYQGASDIAYLYEGWNVVAEYEMTVDSVPMPPVVTVALIQACTWGLDLSGSLQGAGGVGGLLCIHRGPGTDGSGNRTWTTAFYPTYDGNGNISEYLEYQVDIDPGTSGNQPGTVAVAHFEYDPFGKMAASSGAVADFTYRFSTKPQDFETGLYYYGYRYYDPVTGRWPSRDPIGERGGINTYSFVGNIPVNLIDVLGLADLHVIIGANINQKNANPHAGHETASLTGEARGVDSKNGIESIIRAGKREFKEDKQANPEGKECDITHEIVVSSKEEPMTLDVLRKALQGAKGARAVVYTGHGAFIKDGKVTEDPEGAQTGTVVVTSVYRGESGSVLQAYGDIVTWEEILKGVGEKADIKKLTELGIMCCYSGRLPKEASAGFKLYSLTPEAGDRALHGTETSIPLKLLVKKLCCDKAKEGAAK